MVPEASPLQAGLAVEPLVPLVGMLPLHYARRATRESIP